MKFLVDAQLPRRLAVWLDEAGFPAVHTFVDSFVLLKKPYKLLLISTGNISNPELESLFKANIKKLQDAFDAGSEFVELNETAIVVHN